MIEKEVYMKYLTVAEAAKKRNVTRRRVQQLCRNGEISGIIKDGRLWLIPDTDNDHENPAFLKPLPVGVSDFAEAVMNYYYADKTLLIRDLIDTLPKVSLFTRPRRFGKTLNMDMLRVFFEKTEEDTSVYFTDKAIWACGEKYRRYQSRYPVIWLSFKDVKYNKWETALKDISLNIAAEYARHSELAESIKCSGFEKQLYEKITSGSADETELARSLSVLSSMLHKHNGVPAVIIIDEYDTPIQQGYTDGYYDDVIRFMRNLFSGAFKDNPSLAFGFLTGILRVAKESIFSVMNNLKVNTVLDERFSSYFGFTHEDVKDLLTYYGREDKYDEICDWYDGYRFGECDIFNPWSVINYIDENCFPKAFWLSTGSNAVIGDIIQSADPKTAEALRKLLQGEQLSSYLDTSVIYPEITHNPSGLFSFLLMAGYLKNNGILPQSDGNYICRLKIPNREISIVFEKEIISRLHVSQGESAAVMIQQALFEQDTEKLTDCLNDYLIQTISVFDTADEAFYQGLLLGLCAILNNRYRVLSNRESGQGRFDIQLYPLIKGCPGYIIELKMTKDPAQDLDALADQALRQIELKQYDSEMKTTGITDIIYTGIAFFRKKAVVKTQNA